MDSFKENQKRSCSDIPSKNSKSRKLNESINDEEKNALVEKFLNVEKAVVEYVENYKNYPTIINNYREYYSNLEKVNQIQFSYLEKEFNLPIVQSQECNNNKILTYLKHIKKTAKELEDFCE
ncbi:unnamed protein product [Brachionus calyciflorus]|uniref:Uncharacterized protein n=1 Tax=Brachionus calyciflorus TaxID=104777 RepID=A0A813Z2N7_9BILA|nr:unnamed protein product [Brachionus calyciflorus]